MFILSGHIAVDSIVSAESPGAFLFLADMAAADQVLVAGHLMSKTSNFYTSFSSCLRIGFWWRGSLTGNLVVWISCSVRVCNYKLLSCWGKEFVYFSMFFSCRACIVLGRLDGIYEVLVNFLELLDARVVSTPTTWLAWIPFLFERSYFCYHVSQAKAEDVSVG